MRGKGGEEKGVDEKGETIADKVQAMPAGFLRCEKKTRRRNRTKKVAEKSGKRERV